MSTAYSILLLVVWRSRETSHVLLAIVILSAAKDLLLIPEKLKSPAVQMHIGRDVACNVSASCRTRHVRS